MLLAGQDSVGALTLGSLCLLDERRWMMGYETDTSQN